MKQRNESSDDERTVRDNATRESWPLNDDRANYELARVAREAQAEGRERARA